MGKSSSSSGELSGGRWPVADPPEGAAPLGTAEDELWTLLEVIEKKGTRLRRDLERAEVRERELGHTSDPTAGETSSPPPTDKWRGPGGDWWPHSLPGAGPRLDFVPGLEAWGEVERLRVDRLYLMGRLQRAEAEGGAAHQRLLDLHSQLVALAAEKRRLEDAFRALKIGDQFAGASGSKGNKGVTVSIGDSSGTCNKKSSSVRIGEDFFLPRVLKVPIKDKYSSKPPSKIPQGIGSTPKNDSNNPSSKTIVLFPANSKTFGSSGQSVETTTSSPPTGLPNSSALEGDRVVIERERNANRVDGGLSMPASLLKGAKIKVHPNKQRISAILKERDVLALQRQLLTTVMETEVLRRQLEMAGEEWENRLKEWETELNKHKEKENNLLAENIAIRKQLDYYRNIQQVDVGVSANPLTHSVAVGTSDEPETPTYSVHQGPNVKYDVVVFEDNNSSKQNKTLSVTSRKPQIAIEKPPRRTRPLSVGPTGDTPSFGRDSLGRVTKVPLKPSTRTPPATPRSSPSPSMSVPRNTGGRIPLQDSIPVSRGSSLASSSRTGVSRRDSMKVAIGSSGAGSSSPVSKGGPNKSNSLLSNSNNNPSSFPKPLSSSSSSSHFSSPVFTPPSPSPSPSNTTSKSSPSTNPNNDSANPNFSNASAKERNLLKGDIKANTLWPHSNASGSIKGNNWQSTRIRRSVEDVTSISKERNANNTEELESRVDDEVTLESKDFFDSITENVPSSPLYSRRSSCYSPHIEFLPASPRLWTPIYGHTLSLHKGLSHMYNDNPSQLGQEHQDKNFSGDSLEVAITVPESDSREIKTYPSSEVTLYKGIRCKVPGGVLRLKRNQERPSVLSMENRNTQSKLSRGQNANV
ncbi:hypothetical protein Avbf_12096 [Armadillidium vulgare]|nr:hypothetical protein Avbf_12096 [Armadillidium vulgare]